MEKREKEKRDIRLLIALSLFITAMIAGLIQAWILQLYLDAAISGHWAYFSHMFSVQPPASGPDAFCFGRCVADLPFLAGWIGIASFLLGVVVLVHCWWKPKSSDAR
ncbi:hypothetical protein BA950_07735 [Erythrobacter sp. SAORIC-644]|uniref:hypothetical protein n=1 Tax=Erythrobacter sp. SAORIC-644 TaxID=1869314 RepID=UPI000C9F0D3B|nr:hypothetical protein [Erythrobacter sp. SAORIC-644]PNQ76359.1 hypothetical protein BA950_07735 [Erythrobacter sp. SAORIC-644]